MANITTRVEKGAALTFSEVDANFSGLNEQLLTGTGSRNALINANPIINQRGYVSGTATATANQYTLDRWRVATSGQSISWSDSGNVRTVTAPAGGVEQVIEGLNLVTGNYTLNWTGTASATVAGVAVTKGGIVSLAGGSDTVVRFSGGTFSQAQLEPGTNATQLERRPYGHELALCQRYFQRGASYGWGYASDVAPWVPQRASNCFFTCQMRVAPTITFLTGSGVNTGGQYAQGISTTSFGIYTVPTVAGNYSLDTTWSANAEI